MAQQKTIKIEQVGSPQRRHFDQRATLIGLGTQQNWPRARCAGYAGNARDDPQGGAHGARAERRDEIIFGVVPGLVPGVHGLICGWRA